MMAKNEFDAYREALVVETRTWWPDEYDGWDESQKAQVAARLHGDPKTCQQLVYERMHKGFCRTITVTPEDLQRLGL
jgi:hypothetical protein